MNEIAQYLAGLRGYKLKDEDEDGNASKLETNPGLTDAELLDYERSIGHPLPRLFRELLSYSNGMSLFGLSIMPKSELGWHRAQGLLAFHNWANGDFDCIAVASSTFTFGQIVFINHSPDAAVRVENSLFAWMKRVVEEIRQHRTLLHPMDYRQRRATGVYQHVLLELEGVDCELNQ